MELNEVLEYIQNHPEHKHVIEDTLEYMKKEEAQKQALTKAQKIADELNDLSNYIEDYCLDGFCIVFHCSSYCFTVEAMEKVERIDVD